MTMSRNIERKRESLFKILPIFAQMLAYFQVYPDKFIDFLLPKDSKFKLYPFQRIYLRIMFRYKKVYLTATRGTSKSFLNILAMYLKCIMFPNIKLSLIAPQKNQASQIAQQNIEAIWNFIPLLRKEVNIKRSHMGRDYTRLVFWNNSTLDIVVASQGSRGLRRHGLSFEEIVQMDKHRETIGEVLLPLLANNRKGVDGKVSEFEIHKQIMYITTASTKQSYAWEQLHDVMVDMANGKSAFVVGNGWELPVMFEQLDENYVEEVKDDPSVSPLQFAREYESIWTGSSEDSLVQLKDLNSCRVLTDPEFEAKKGDHEYIISVDVARSQRKGSATTMIAIFKIIPRGDGTYFKQLVNLFTYVGNMHFEDQSIFLKEQVDKYNASMLVIDGNGLGRGLLDFLVKEDKYPSYSVVNDNSYDDYKLPNSLPLIFNISSNTSETNASDIHNNFMTAIANHDLKLLVTESTIKSELSERDPEKAMERLMPHIETNLFVDEVMNLKYEARGNRTVVKSVSSSMGKDRYSAISYGLFYIYLKEKKNNIVNRSKFNPLDFIAVRKPNFKVRSWR